jgi:hypothetical protein
MTALNPMPARDPVGNRRPLGDANGDRVERRAPVSRNDGAGTPPVEAFAPERYDRHDGHADDDRLDEPRKGMLRRHPLSFVGGLILLAVLLPAGYLFR